MPISWFTWGIAGTHLIHDLMCQESVGSMIASESDAADGAFVATIYGNVQLSYFEVWTYQCNPLEMDVRSTVDLSKRLHGTTELRYPYHNSIV